MQPRLALRGALKIELDDFRRAGGHEEQKLDVGAALQKLRHDAVEFVVEIGHAGQIALLQNGGGEARLGEDHHPRRRLDQMRAGARADHEEERVADLSMQPDDAGEAAEHFALAALVGDGGAGGGERRVHRDGSHCSESEGA